MSILKGLRERLASAGSRARSALITERLNFSAAIPGYGADGAGGAPLWQMDVQTVTEPQGDGEKLRLRAHIQANLASVLRDGLNAPPREDRHTLPSARRALTRSERVGQLAQRAAQSTIRGALGLPVIRALAQPLLDHDFHTWIELQASTASLDQGAKDLLPAREQLERLGIQPLMHQDAPIAQSWAGESPRGFAQVSLLQIDKRKLPQRLVRTIGDKPFSLAAAIVNVAEEKPSR